ncbi:DUF6221 family protein [Acrocarpospora sp. B8E8]|uniref:DUF6221 family protein n=1 Tax=Acrocarpospora sp. B8E8 TaxID=3153572 RepID=UPI00325FD904
MGDLTTFLNARWDEEEQDLRGHLGKALVQGYLRHNGERLLADIESKRAVLRRCAAFAEELDVHPNGLVSPRALLARQTLRLLALPFAGEDGYKEEWRP